MNSLFASERLNFEVYLPSIWIYLWMSIFSTNAFCAPWNDTSLCDSPEFFKKLSTIEKKYLSCNRNRNWDISGSFCLNKMTTTESRSWSIKTRKENDKRIDLSWPSITSNGQMLLENIHIHIHNKCLCKSNFCVGWWERKKGKHHQI